MRVRNLVAVREYRCVPLLALLVVFVGAAPSLAATFSETGNLEVARYGHTATLLPNGKVLIAGGNNGANNLNTAELYDPAD